MNTKEEIIAAVISGEVTNVKFVDDTDYNPENCRNGGSYSFSTEYRKIGADNGIVTGIATMMNTALQTI